MPAPHNSADSPVMQQYLGIKERYPDSVLMFRMGDFYEMFFEDALTVGPILDIAVTSRDKNAADPVPMAGVPYHAIGGYLRTLVEQGVKVAICEQLETPAEAKKRKGKAKIVHRDVVRVVTPGALMDDEHLQSSESNYFAVVIPTQVKGQDKGTKGPMAFGVLDISCGDFQVQHLPSLEALPAELARLAPKELLAPGSLHASLKEALGQSAPCIEPLEHPPSPAQIDRVTRLLAQAHPETTPSPSLCQAAGYLLAYAEHTQPGQALLIHRLRCHNPHDHLHLDETSLRNLEVFHTLRDQQSKGSLRWAIDRTRTAMGARTLKQWLGAPLRNLEAIEARQDAVQLLVDRGALRQNLREQLKDQRDIVRLAARARLGTISPRELGVLRDALLALPDLNALFSQLDEEPGAELLALGEDLCEPLCEILTLYLVDAPPGVARDGGMIRDGADAALDEQRQLRDGGQRALSDIEARERESTGISNLKVQHNRVFGYFFEVSKRELQKVPEHYVRKQTTANAERYVTPELAQLESKVLAAQELALARELELLEMLRQRAGEVAEQLVYLGESVAQIDVLASFAQLAQSQNYVRPTWCGQSEIEIQEGRHPVIEQLVPEGGFVPNPTHLCAKGSKGIPRLWLITGPNMGGKSTMMRQVALIVILAQIGCFVPASSARLGLVDRIFTRVGAADDLGRGDSTFMVEMRETAEILRHASPRSLVLLDEIGRGTATFDGLSLAWAVAEHLHDQVGCQTMFATHYHELCNLEQRLTALANVHVAAKEERGEIRFLHRIQPGAAGRSYGIQVGRLAGLPAGVLRRATKILSRLEQSSGQDPSDQLQLFAPRADEDNPVPMPTPEAPPSGLALALAELSLDDLTPRQAHRLLEEWQEQYL